ncbi:hypothetical protein [Lacticaseibacillus rhamnosus]|nr:hypothetical protein [Lacticaseibacillus rhamnosus]
MLLAFFLLVLDCSEVRNRLTIHHLFGNYIVKEGGLIGFQTGYLKWFGQ